MVNGRASTLVSELILENSLSEYTSTMILNHIQIAISDLLDETSNQYLKSLYDGELIINNFSSHISYIELEVMLKFLRKIDRFASAALQNPNTIELTIKILSNLRKYIISVMCLNP